MTELERIETPNHSREQIAGYLDAAAELLAERGLSPEANELVYCKTVELLSSKQITIVQRQQVGGLVVPTMNGVVQ